MVSVACGLIARTGINSRNMESLLMSMGLTFTVTMPSTTSCARGDTICPRPLYAGAQLQSIPYACGALLTIAVGSMNINELMNINEY